MKSFLHTTGIDTNSENNIKTQKSQEKEVNRCRQSLSDSKTITYTHQTSRRDIVKYKEDTRSRSRSCSRTRNLTQQNIWI